MIKSVLSPKGSKRPIVKDPWANTSTFSELVVS